MIYRALDASGDYSFGKSMQDFLRDAESVGQAVKTNLRLLLAEWWEDVTEGLPLFQNILGQPGGPDDLKAVDLIIKDRIMSTQGVASMSGYQRIYENRQLTITCTITTITGQTTTVEVSF